MNKYFLFALLPQILLFNGCTQRQLYEAIQENQRNECSRLQLNDYKHCIEKYSKPYNQYIKEHQEILSTPDKHSNQEITLD